ncbi:hypothetical protein [Agathobaculum sp.]|uniref:hypothetical protein n=1 Tax=Agathobaculum sp. TaxID=2048138 RepID=UPI002A830454|nr:hypothetical protein [Agathobaculum sp.]MDY3617825.1 hypothetical protein [Agathobaculum sp.]
MLHIESGGAVRQERHILLCIDTSRRGELTGRAYGGNPRRAVSFSAMLPLLRLIDGWLDENPVTERPEQRRGLLPGAPPEHGRFCRLETAAERPGHVATFIIRVRFRQNSSWQGEAVWLERERKVFFRSALELLRMIDDALLTSEQEREQSNAWLG